ncbi:MAG: class I SAM-dependent methyltransferase [Planctomycetaceae bacterium]
MTDAGPPDGPRARREAALSANARAWDRLAADGAALARPAADEAFGDPRRWLGSAGTAGRPWLPERLDGLEVLCLAAGGGKHGPLYAAAGARVTVLDLAPAMLALDRSVAAERRIDLEIVQGSMDDLRMFAAGRFDVVIHPVSTCYLPDVQPVFREVARVTRPGGTYISQHKQPASLQAGLVPAPGGRFELEHRQARRDHLPPAPPSRVREPGAREFIHSLSDLLGGICRAGFVIEDLGEPDHTRPAALPGSFADRASFLPPYLRVLARRAGPGAAAGPGLLLQQGIVMPQGSPPPPGALP